LQNFLEFEKSGLKIERKNFGISFWVSVRPRSPETKILKIENEVLKISLKSLPTENLANIELIKFLKKEFGFQNVEIVIGKTSKKKKIFVQI